MRDRGFLLESGWLESYLSRRPVDRYGNPLPWVTYSFLYFISPRLSTDLSLFEYGAGNSTLFYATRVGEIVSVEHDGDWIRALQAEAPSNVTLVHSGLSDSQGYARSALQQDLLFDIICVDGRHRNESLLHAPDALSSRGTIVLDDSERTDYAPGINAVTARGFRRLDFWGMAAMIYYRKCTTIFYRAENCLGI